MGYCISVSILVFLDHFCNSKAGTATVRLYYMVSILVFVDHFCNIHKPIIEEEVRKIVSILVFVDHFCNPKSTLSGICG